jgi:hypothetical protein
MIPPEVVEAAAVTLMGRMMVSHQDALHVWSGMYEPEKDQFRREARAAIAAAIAAWPDVTDCDHTRPIMVACAAIILPLTQQASDD